MPRWDITDDVTGEVIGGLIESHLGDYKNPEALASGSVLWWAEVSMPGEREMVGNLRVELRDGLPYVVAYYRAGTGDSEQIGLAGPITGRALASFERGDRSVVARFVLGADQHTHRAQTEPHAACDGVDHFTCVVYNGAMAIIKKKRGIEIPLAAQPPPAPVDDSPMGTTR